jgi:hypothetical protein
MFENLHLIYKKTITINTEVEGWQKNAVLLGVT